MTDEEGTISEFELRVSNNLGFGSGPNDEFKYILNTYTQGSADNLLIFEGKDNFEEKKK